MIVFIAGATGVLGRRLACQFDEWGAEIVGLSRDVEGDWIVGNRGATHYRGDILDTESTRDGMGETDAVIHAATANTGTNAIDRSYWE